LPIGIDPANVRHSRAGSNLRKCRLLKKHSEAFRGQAAQTGFCPLHAARTSNSRFCVFKTTVFTGFLGGGFQRPDFSGIGRFRPAILAIRPMADCGGARQMM
jgi:hypothetical protein